VSNIDAIRYEMDDVIRSFTKLEAHLLGLSHDHYKAIKENINATEND